MDAQHAHANVLERRLVIVQEHQAEVRALTRERRRLAPAQRVRLGPRGQKSRLALRIAIVNEIELQILRRSRTRSSIQIDLRQHVGRSQIDVHRLVIIAIEADGRTRITVEEHVVGSASRVGLREIDLLNAVLRKARIRGQILREAARVVAKTHAAQLQSHRTLARIRVQQGHILHTAGLERQIRERVVGGIVAERGAQDHFRMGLRHRHNGIRSAIEVLRVAVLVGAVTHNTQIGLAHHVHTHTLNHSVGSHVTCKDARLHVEDAVHRQFLVRILHPVENTRELHTQVRTQERLGKRERGDQRIVHLSHLLLLCSRSRVSAAIERPHHPVARIHIVFLDLIGLRLANHREVVLLGSEVDDVAVINHLQTKVHQLVVVRSLRHVAQVEHVNLGEQHVRDLLITHQIGGIAFAIARHVQRHESDRILRLRAIGGHSHITVRVERNNTGLHRSNQNHLQHLVGVFHRGRRRVAQAHVERRKILFCTEHHICQSVDVRLTNQSQIERRAAVRQSDRVLAIHRLTEYNLHRSVQNLSAHELAVEYNGVVHVAHDARRNQAVQRRSHHRVRLVADLHIGFVEAVLVAHLQSCLHSEQHHGVEASLLILRNLRGRAGSSALAARARRRDHAESITLRQTNSLQRNLRLQIVRNLLQLDREHLHHTHSGVQHSHIQTAESVAHLQIHTSHRECLRGHAVLVMDLLDRHVRGIDAVASSESDLVVLRHSVADHSKRVRVVVDELGAAQRHLASLHDREGRNHRLMEGKTIEHVAQLVSALGSRESHLRSRVLHAEHVRRSLRHGDAVRGLTHKRNLVAIRNAKSR